MKVRAARHPCWLAPIELRGGSHASCHLKKREDDWHSCADFLFTNPECRLYLDKSGAFEILINPLDALNMYKIPLCCGAHRPLSTLFYSDL